MNFDNAFLARLASELARLRLEVATLQTFLAQRTGADPDSIRQTIDLIVQDPAFQDVAQEIFERLRGS